MWKRGRHAGCLTIPQLFPASTSRRRDITFSRSLFQVGQPSIDDNNYRVTMDDFLIRLPRPCTLARIHRDIGSFVSRTVRVRFRHWPLGCAYSNHRWLLERIPISDMQIDLPGLPDLCYETDVSPAVCVSVHLLPATTRIFTRGAIVPSDLYPSVETHPLRGHVSPARTTTSLLALSYLLFLMGEREREFFSLCSCRDMQFRLMQFLVFWKLDVVTTSQEASNHLWNYQFVETRLMGATSYVQISFVSVRSRLNGGNLLRVFFEMVLKIS